MSSAPDAAVLPPKWLSVQSAGTVDLHGQAVSYPAALALLRGQAYDALENHGRAIRWYRQALKFDPFCYEAFQVSLCRSSCDHCMLHCHSAGTQPGLQNLSTFHHRSPCSFRLK